MEPVVLAKAIPGFVGNRLQFAVLREALNIVRSGRRRRMWSIGS
jgi:3-hydroxyacyl-CoA dehydrogenase